jgi:hypothetical protein
MTENPALLANNARIERLHHGQVQQLIQQPRRLAAALQELPQTGCLLRWPSETIARRVHT